MSVYSRLGFSNVCLFPGSKELRKVTKSRETYDQWIQMDIGSDIGDHLLPRGHNALLFLEVSECTVSLDVYVDRIV